MHELGIVFSIMNTLEDVAKENKLPSIRSVTLRWARYPPSSRSRHPLRRLRGGLPHGGLRTDLSPLRKRENLAAHRKRNQYQRNHG